MSSMTITLDGRQEQAIRAAIRSSKFRAANEFIDAAIAAISSKTPILAGGPMPPESNRRSRLWELREGLVLGGTAERELIEEGRE